MLCVVCGVLCVACCVLCVVCVRERERERMQERERERKKDRERERKCACVYTSKYASRRVHVGECVQMWVCKYYRCVCA